MARIPIKALKQLAKERGQTHLILFAMDEDGKTQHVVTYGRSLEQCSQAADFGNRLKDYLGWPKSLHQQPSRVRKLQARISELEAEVEHRGGDVWLHTRLEDLACEADHVAQKTRFSGFQKAWEAASGNIRNAARAIHWMRKQK